MKKKKRQELNEELYMDLNESSSSDELIDVDKGSYNLKDFIAPPSLDRSDFEHLVVGKQYVRNFVMQGFPNQVYVGWLNALYNAEAEIDTMIHVEPADDRAALDALTAKITQFEAQLATEQERGNIRNVTRLGDAIQDLYEERRKLERNIEKLYQVEILANLYADSKENLEKETQKLDNKLRGRKIYLMPNYLRQDDGYKSTLPIGKSFITDKYRNFNSGALTACFPFYNSEITHENGVFIGVRHVGIPNA